MRKILTFCFALCIFLSSASQARQVTDANLKKCIADAAGGSFSSLTENDLSDITSLACKQMNIQSIVGIEKLHNLKELNFNNNRISDLALLAELDGLEKLYLWNNSIKDISPLAGLKNLKELHIERNLIENLEPLAKLDDIEELLLGSNRISDISPLAGLGQLFWLELYDNQITDISSLDKLTRLEYLDISKNSISNIDTLKKLKNLGRLYLHENSIFDIQALGDLKAVRILFLGNNQVADISPLVNYGEISILDLDANQISNIKVLGNLASLERLRMDNNLVSDLSPLAGSEKLVEVSLLNNCVKDTGAVAHVKKVTGLEYQHDLCSSPNLVKKNVTEEWLDSKIEEQCVDYGENDYSLKNDYEYYPDGIYYNFHERSLKHDTVRKLTCRLPWNSNIDNFLHAIEKIKSIPGKHDVFKYNNFHIYALDDRIKGYSVNKQRKVRGEYSILKDISDLFQISYTFKKQRVSNNDILTAMNKGYVVRIVDDGENYSLQYFEREFFDFNVLAE